MELFPKNSPETANTVKRLRFKTLLPKLLHITLLSQMKYYILYQNYQKRTQSNGISFRESLLFVMSIYFAHYNFGQKSCSARRKKRGKFQNNTPFLSLLFSRYKQNYIDTKRLLLNMYNRRSGLCW